MDQHYDFNYFLFNKLCILVLYKMLCTFIHHIKVKVNQYLQGQSQGKIQNIFGTWCFFVMGVSEMELNNLMPILII